MDYNANNIEHDEFATYSKEAQKNRINAEKEKRNEIKNAQEKCNEILERYKKNTGERLPVGNADLLKWNPSDKELEEIANR